MNGTSRRASMPPCIRPSGTARPRSVGSDRPEARDDASRRRRVSFAPPQPVEVRRRLRRAELKGFRPEYALGDLCRRRGDMVVERTREEAFRSVLGMRLKVSPSPR